MWRSVESPLRAGTRDSPWHMTDRCARFLDRNFKGIFFIASFATVAENLSNMRLPHCPINMKSTNATIDFKHPLSDLIETTTFARLHNSEGRLTLTRGGFLPRPYRGSWNGPNMKDYTMRDKYAEQSSMERRHCFAIATPTLRAAQTCFVIWLICEAHNSTDI